jgi:hypothetical protein
VKLIAVVQVAWEPEWYNLEINNRVRFRGQLAQVLKSSPDVQCRWFDSEPWTGRIAEFFVCQFSNMHHYWQLWNKLRELPIFRANHARIKRVCLGVERSLLEDKVKGL